MKLNLGCGKDIREGYENIDLNSTNTKVKRLNVMLLSEYFDKSIEEILAHSVLEHLSTSDLRPALKEWNRVLEVGGILVIPTGVTVNFAGGLQAQVAQIFNCSGTGAVTINAAITGSGYPEWWGAQVNSASFDCAPAINACIVACQTTYLQAAIYYTASTIYQQTAHRNVIGVLGNPQGAGAATSITITSPTITVWFIGPNSGPTLQSNNVLKNVALNRSVAPNVSNANASTALFVQYTVWTTVDNVWTYNHCIGFLIQNNAGGHYTNCVGSRTAAGVNADNGDRYFGFFLQGNSATTPGLYSLYINNCIIAQGAGITRNSYGIYASGTYGINDLFITQVETSQLSYGIFLQGNPNSTTTVDYYNEDIKIVDCVLDTCLVAGIYFNQISSYGAITVTGGYAATYPFSQAATYVSGGTVGTNTFVVNDTSSVAYGQVVAGTGIPANTFVTAVTYATNTVTLSNNFTVQAAGTYGFNAPGLLTFQSSQGSVSIMNMQALMYGAVTPFLTANASKNIMTKNCIVSDCKTLAYDLNAVTNSSFEDQIRNYSSTTTGPLVGVYPNCSRNYFKVMLSGRAGAFTSGYYLVDTTDTYSEYNCTGLDPAAITGGSANKLIYNSTQITTTGTFGTGNLASGVMS